MKKSTKPRIKIGYGYDKRSKKVLDEKRKYILRLSKTEISLLKAVLPYYALADDFGYAYWTTGGGSVGRTDHNNMRLIYGDSISGGLLDELNHLSKVKPTYCWGNLDAMAELLGKELDKYKKHAKKMERKYGMPPLQLAGRSEKELKEIEEYHSKSKEQQKQNKNNHGKS
ncbi:MAG: hypothetical protein A2868_03640 [Candidatus Levybacteria bacterium RIFCSPHIGHO2_01_FULL_40_15b]|nr:MAG: hypothetical protein A2868_03640 [Candidatus Levybacteria bacterium RIFCSPHIGHO2_01_FULL_40_15b]